jgi:hypothetical protein
LRDLHGIPSRLQQALPVVTQITGIWTSTIPDSLLGHRAGLRHMFLDIARECQLVYIAEQQKAMQSRNTTDQ